MKRIVFLLLLVYASSILNVSELYAQKVNVGVITVIKEEEKIEKEKKEKEKKEKKEKEQKEKKEGIVSVQPRAIGANLGYGASFSYQHSFGEANFLDVNVDLPFFAGIGAAITYDWVDPFNAPVPWNEKGSWNWYLGVGASGGMYGLFVSGLNGAYVGVAGHVGIAYDFWFPLQLSLDYRPNIGVSFWENGVGFNNHGFYGISLGVRYRF